MVNPIKRATTIKQAHSALGPPVITAHLDPKPPACHLLGCRYKAPIIKHCLEVYGRLDSQQEAADQAAGTSLASSAQATTSSSTSSYVLEERQVCLHYARKLLKQRATWPLHEFMPAWQQEVPGGCWCPQEEMLAGEALVLQPDPNEGERWRQSLGCLHVWLPCYQHTL